MIRLICLASILATGAFALPSKQRPAAVSPDVRCRRAVIFQGQKNADDQNGLQPDQIALIQSRFSSLKMTVDQVLYVDELFGPSVAQRGRRKQTAYLLKMMKGDSAWLTTLFHALVEWNRGGHRWKPQDGVGRYLANLITDEWRDAGLDSVATTALSRTLLKALDTKVPDSPQDLVNAIEDVLNWYRRETSFNGRSKLYQFALLHGRFDDLQFSKEIYWHLRHAWRTPKAEWTGWNPFAEGTTEEGERRYTEDLLDGEEPPLEDKMTIHGALARNYPGISRESVYERAIIGILDNALRDRSFRARQGSSQQEIADFGRYVQKKLTGWVKTKLDLTRHATAPHLMRREGLKVFAGEIAGITYRGKLEHLVSHHATSSRFGLNALKWICQVLGYELLLVGDQSVGREFGIAGDKKVDVVAVETREEGGKRHYVLHAFELKESQPGRSGGHHRAELSTKAEIEYAVLQLETTQAAIVGKKVEFGKSHIVLLPNSVIDVVTGYNIYYFERARGLHLYLGEVPVLVGGEPVGIAFVSSK